MCSYTATAQLGFTRNYACLWSVVFKKRLKMVQPPPPPPPVLCIMNFVYNLNTSDIVWETHLETLNVNALIRNVKVMPAFVIQLLNILVHSYEFDINPRH
jgi:hypothetical protein